MVWLPDLSWLSGSLLLGIAITIVTVTSALLALWWQHNKALKNPWSHKSLIMAGICLVAGLFSIINLVQEDAEAQAKDQQMAFLTAEITGYRTAIQSQAIGASSTPIHAMFVFHPKGVDYDRALKDIDFELDDPRIKPFFYQDILASGSIEIDINTLFRYELGWWIKQREDGSEISMVGGRKDVRDRLGSDTVTFSAICKSHHDLCTLMVDADGDSTESDAKEVLSKESGIEGRFGVLGGKPDGIFAISLNNDVTWSDILRAAGAPFQSSWYGKGSYGAMRFPKIGPARLQALKDVLEYQDLYFGFEFLSEDKKRPGCMMARLPVTLEFWRFEKAAQANEQDVAAFLMKAGSPSMEIVDCADHWQHDERIG
jgi:hypothetical protein